MNIVAKQLEATSAVAVSNTRLKKLSPEEVFSAFLQNKEGARYFDDPILSVQAFHLPQANLRLILEPQRMRLEDMGTREPKDSELGRHLSGLVEKLFPGQKNAFVRHGFNYEINFRYDNVLAQDKILDCFLPADILPAVTHFGWQFTLSKKKSKETYFCKAVSPIELRVLTNVEIDGPLENGGLAQGRFEKCYTEVAKVIAELNLK